MLVEENINFSITACLSLDILSLAIEKAKFAYNLVLSNSKVSHFVLTITHPSVDKSSIFLETPIPEDGSLDPFFDIQDL